MPSLTVMSLNETSQQLHSLPLATNCLISGRDCDSADYHSVAQVEQQIPKHVSASTVFAPTLVNENNL